MTYRSFSVNGKSKKQKCVNECSGRADRQCCNLARSGSWFVGSDLRFLDTSSCNSSKTFARFLRVDSCMRIETCNTSFYMHTYALMARSNLNKGHPLGWGACLPSSSFAVTKISRSGHELAGDNPEQGQW